MVIYHDKVCAHICWYMDTIYIRDCQWGLLRARSRSGVGGQIPALLLQGGGNAGQDWKAEAVAVVCH